MGVKMPLALAVGAALLLILVLWIFLPSDKETVSVATAPLPEDKPVGDLEIRPTLLFFPGNDDVLHVEARELPAASDIKEQASLIARAVLAGPTTDGLQPPLPPGIAVGHLDVSADGAVYLDLVSETFTKPPARGTRVELLSLYSLVNSIVHNVEGAESVVILWNSRQPVTFGGHIDTSRPVRPEMGLVADNATLLP